MPHICYILYMIYAGYWKQLTYANMTINIVKACRKQRHCEKNHDCPNHMLCNVIGLRCCNEIFF